MNSNLVRKQIVDSRGNTTTRWVRPESGASSVSLPAPRPSLPRGAVKEMTAIKNDLLNRLRDNEPPRNLWGRGEKRNWQDSFAFVREAYAASDYELLKVFDRFIPDHDRMTLFLKDAVEIVRNMGYDKPSEVITKEFSDDTDRIRRKLLIATVGGLPEPLKAKTHVELRGLADKAVELVFLNPGAGDRIMYLIDLGANTPDALESMLSESEGIADSLIDGVL